MAQPAARAPIKPASFNRAPTATREAGVAFAGLVVLGLVGYGSSLGRVGGTA
jgi:hypothetical protein